MLNLLVKLHHRVSCCEAKDDANSTAEISASRTRLAEQVSSVPAVRSKARQLLVDVSVIQKYDANTGIQRVVRNVLRQLLDKPPLGYEVRPVFATRLRGYRYVKNYLDSFNGTTEPSYTMRAIQVESGDIFLGLDLAAHLLPHHQNQLARWKKRGVKFFPVVYDLLPALHPEWFTPKAVKAYRAWLRSLVHFADGAVCISKSVAIELSDYLHTHFGTLIPQISIQWFHLGCEIDSNFPVTPYPEDFEVLLQTAKDRPSVLMLGTVEPRKGYAQALSAFELLWQSGCEINLIIVGKPGWGVEELIQRLRKHPEINNRLFWLEAANDQMLSALFLLITGVLMASEGEGFGLPLVESAHYGKPVLARDIPVFREVAGNGANYFSETTAEGLSACISNWLSELEKSGVNIPRSIKLQGWAESAEQLLACLGLVYDEGVGST